MSLADAAAAGPPARRVRVLTFDIETRPITAHVWGLWDQRVGLNQIIDPGGVLCFAAKWYGEKDILFYSEHVDGHDAMIRAAHALLSEADFVVHYNGQRFDVPHLNREFVQLGLGRPTPYKQVDLLRVARSQFKFPSNKLDYVAGALGLGHKVSHEGHTLWTKCPAGDEAAWKRMERYNRGDVRLTERLYERLLPWIPNHPHLGLYNGRGDCCPNCGGTKFEQVENARTALTSYAQFRCKRCGTFTRNNFIRDRVTSRATR